MAFTKYEQLSDNVFMAEDEKKLVTKLNKVEPGLIEKSELVAKKAQELATVLKSKDLLPMTNSTSADGRTALKPSKFIVKMSDYEKDGVDHYKFSVKFSANGKDFELSARENMENGEASFNYVTVKEFHGKGVKPDTYELDKVPDDIKGIAEVVKTFVKTGGRVERGFLAELATEIKKSIPDSEKKEVTGKDGKTFLVPKDIYFNEQQPSEFDKSRFGEKAKGKLIIGSNAKDFDDMRLELREAKNGKVSVVFSKWAVDENTNEYVVAKNGNDEPVYQTDYNTKQPKLDENGEKIPVYAREYHAAYDKETAVDLATETLGKIVEFIDSKYGIAPEVSEIERVDRNLKKVIKDANDIIAGGGNDGKDVNNVYGQLTSDEYGYILTIKSHEDPDLNVELIENEDGKISANLVHWSEGADGKRTNTRDKNITKEQAGKILPDYLGEFVANTLEYGSRIPTKKKDEISYEN